MRSDRRPSEQQSLSQSQPHSQGLRGGYGGVDQGPGVGGQAKPLPQNQFQSEPRNQFQAGGSGGQGGAGEGGVPPSYAEAVKGDHKVQR